MINRLFLWIGVIIEILKLSSILEDVIDKLNIFDNDLIHEYVLNLSSFNVFLPNLKFLLNYQIFLIFYQFYQK